MASQFPLEQINPNPTTDRKIYTHNGLSSAASVPTELPYFPSSSNAMPGIATLVSTFSHPCVPHIKNQGQPKCAQRDRHTPKDKKTDN